MQSPQAHPDRPGPETTTKTVLLLTAITLNACEFFIPRIPLFPWMKPGLANAVTLVWIIRYGGVDALLFTLLRIWIVGFYFGFSFLPFALSLSGGVAATVVTGLIWHVLGRRRITGLAGLSVAGALVHNAGQLLAVYALMARNIRIFYQIPIMIFASIIFGVLVSLIAVPLLSYSGDTQRRQLLTSPSSIQPSGRPSLGRIAASLSAFALCIALVFISRLLILGIAAAAVTIATQCIERGFWKALFSPLKRFWLLFIAIAAFHLCFSFGKRVEWAPWITYEGMYAAVQQCLKLWAWLQTASILRACEFHRVLMAALHVIFRRRNTTIYAGILALECFPFVIDCVRKRATESAGLAIRNPLLWARRALHVTLLDIANTIETDN